MIHEICDRSMKSQNGPEKGGKKKVTKLKFRRFCGVTYVRREILLSSLE